MTNKGSAKIVNFMTPGVGDLTLGHGFIGHHGEYALSSSLSIYGTLIAIVLWDYNTAFLCHCWFFIIPPTNEGGYIGITLSVRLSVCPSVCADSCLAHNFFMLWHWLTIFGTWVYQHETMCRVHSWSRYDLELWPQGQIYRVFDMFSCLAHNFFLDWHWLTIFGTWMYHHQTMCRLHSWSRFNVDVWPQGQI